MKRIGRWITCFILMTCIAFLVSCASKKDDADLISEGVDTAVTVTGYMDLRDSSSPYFVKEGDKIAVIAPSALPGKAKTEETVEGLKKWGYIPVEGKYVSVEERTLENCIEDLEWALTDPEIKAVFCVRGGYASTEVLDRIPLSLIAETNKPIIGFSDITTYLSAWTKAGLLSIHSPMRDSFVEGLPEECKEVVKKILTGEIPSYRCQGSSYDVPGTAEGILIGGNLATLTSVLNTAYDCTVTDEPYILFLEEVDEDYEHIHRFLTILEHRGVLDKAAGIIFGEWIDYPKECETYNGNSRGGRFESVADMISREFLADRDIPVAFGFPAGHGKVNYPLLMGARLTLEVSEESFSLAWGK